MPIPKPKIDPAQQAKNMARGFYVLDSPTTRHQPARLRAEQACRVPKVVTKHYIDKMLPDASLRAFENSLIPDDDPDLFDY